MDVFPTKRDYWYSFFIALLLIVFLFVSFVLSPSKVNSELALVSTLVSIILSIIVIIYTLVDSSNNKSTSSKIIEASEKISTSTYEINTSTASLTDLTESLINLNLDKKLLNFENTLAGLEERMITMNDKLGTDMTDIKCCLYNLPSKHAITTLNSAEDGTQYLTSIAILMLKGMDEKYYHLNEIVYIFYKLKNANKPLFPFFAKYVSEYFSNENSTKDNNLGKVYCILGFLNFLNCIDWDDKTDKATFFNDSLLDTVKLFEQEHSDKVQIVNKLISKF